MAAVGLLHENPKPTEAEVREGLEGNLCRCTGYHNIVKAVLAAAGAGGDGMTTVEAPAAGVIGTRMLRKEDPALLTGEASTPTTSRIPGALSMTVVRSPYAHARITRSTSRARSACPASSPRTPAPISRDSWAARCRARGRSPTT